MQKLLFSFLFLSIGFHANAQEQAPPAAPQPPDQISQLAEMVGLDEAQEAEIRGIFEETRPKMEALQAEAQTVQTELGELAGPGFDEAAIREKAAELGDLQGELAALSLIMQSKVDSVFTEEQREQLEAMQRQQQQMRQQQMQRQMQQQIQRQMQQQAPQQPAPQNPAPPQQAPQQ